MQQFVFSLNDRRYGDKHFTTKSRKEASDFVDNAEPNSIHDLKYLVNGIVMYSTDSVARMVHFLNGENI